MPLLRRLHQVLGVPGKNSFRVSVKYQQEMNGWRSLPIRLILIPHVSPDHCKAARLRDPVWNIVSDRRGQLSRFFLMAVKCCSSTSEASGAEFD